MHSTSIVSPKKFVWSKDPAVDTSHDDYDEKLYHSSKFDPKHRPLKAGHEAAAAVFTLEPIPQRVLVAIMRMDKGEQLFNAMVYGVTGVDNWTHNGEKVKVKRVKVDGLQRMDQRWLDECKAFNDIELIIELGNAVLELAGVSPLEDRASPSTPAL